MHTTLVHQSIAIIEANQAANGAYVACPAYPTYRYCWFRDGTFIAHAMDLWQRPASARRFYDWAAQMVLARTEAVERCLENAALGRPLNPADLLHTRYTLDGDQGNEEWPNFQLDGFGTLLWGWQRHIQLSGSESMPREWSNAADLLVRYLAALWQRPNYDCWEEFPDQIAVSTLAALYAGLHAISPALECTGGNAQLAQNTAARIKDFVLKEGMQSGHLVKQIGGDESVDGSLLWACVPFGEHGLLKSEDAVMRATVMCIEQDLRGTAGGVHRYRADTFYGGGEWMLLTTLLGEYYATTDQLEKAQDCLAYVEARADEQGHLPEQDSSAALYPAYVEPWQARWGTVARPLLWSHAAYLNLSARLQVP